MPPPFSDNYDPFLDQLMAARGLYGNVAEPLRVPDLNFGEMGGLGQYFNNPLAIVGVQQGLNWAFGQAGLMPSQFAPGRNLYDQYENKRYWASRMTSLQQAATGDRATYVQMLRGIAQMRGTPWGLEQQRAANVISGDVAMMAPILAETMPELFDALHGSRGSATVMARFLHRGGRFGVDPVTGQTGLGAETIGELSREISRSYFAPGQDLTAWRGIGMGQAGALFEELQNRGMVGRSIGTYDPQEQFRRIAGSREGREGFVRRLAEEQPDEFARLRTRAEATIPGFTPDIRTQDTARQVIELLRGQATASPVMDALRQGDPRLAAIVQQQAGRPGAATPDPDRLAANPQLLQAVVQTVRATMPEPELRRLVGDRAQEMLAAGAITNLPVADQVRRLATTDETARQSLEILQRTDPAAYNAMVDRFDRDRRAPDRIAGLALPQQIQALAQNVDAATQAVDTIRQQQPAQFDQLRQVAEQRRPGGALAGLDTDEQVRRIAEAENVTTEAIRTIQQTQPGRFEVLLRQFDANTVARRVRDMAGAVGAMREIFGDMGRPNAPMTELLEGINAMTQGGLATMAPAELERMVRTTQVLSRQTGMGLNAMMGLTAQGAATADQLGLDRQFAVQATQNAAAFGAAFAQVGRGDLPAWGRVDRDRLTLMDQQLRLRAAQSEGANRLGATMRIVEAQQNAGIPVTSGLQQLANAIREGRTEFAPDAARPDQTRSLLMSEGEWRDFMQQQGVQPGTALQMLRAREENQRTIAQFGISNTVRAMQRQDVRQFMAGSFRVSALNALQDSGMGADQATRLADMIGTAQSRALLDMPVDQRTDARLRNRLLGDAARQVLTAENADPAIAARFQGDIQAETGWGNLGRAIAHSPAFAGYRSQHALLDAHNRDVLARQNTQMQQANVTVQMQTAVAGLGQAGPMQRLMDMVQNPPANLAQAVGQIFGGIDPDVVRRRVLTLAPQDAPGLAGVGARERMTVAMQEFLATVQQFQRVGTDRNLTPEQRVAEMRNLQQRAEALRIGGGAATAQIRQELERAGVVRAGEDIMPALQQIHRDPAAFPQLSTEVRNRIIALRAVGGGLDPQAAQTEIQRVLATRGLRPEQLGRVMAGELNVPEDIRNYLQSLQGMGIDATAAQAGIAVNATVGPRQFDDVRLQATLLAQDLGGNIATVLPANATPARVAEATRHAENVISRGAQSVDALLGSIETTRSLGAGGFDLARSVREKQKEIALIARDLGTTPAQVLLKGDRSDPRVQQFLALHGEIQTGLGHISQRLAETGKHGQMSPAEEQAYTSYRAEETRDDDERNRAAVDRALGTDVMAGLASPEQRQEAVQLLGTGVEGEYRRRKLEQAMQAREQLQKIEKRGLSFAQIREEAAHPTGLLSALEQQSVAEDLRRAGALGEGASPENLRQFLDTMGKPKPDKAAAGDPNKPTEITLRGKLDLSNGQMTAQGETVTPLGATPAVV